jgi:hypothetical protein
MIAPGEDEQQSRVQRRAIQALNLHSPVSTIEINT